MAPGSRSTTSSVAGAISEGHWAGLGHAPHIPQDGRDPDLRTRLRDSAPATGALLPAITRKLYMSEPAIAADVARVLEKQGRPEPD